MLWRVAGCTRHRVAWSASTLPFANALQRLRFAPSVKTAQHQRHCFATLGGRRAKKVVSNKAAPVPASVAGSNVGIPLPVSSSAPAASGTPSNSTGVPTDEAKSKFVIALKDVSFHLPDGTPLFEDVTISLLRGAKIGVVGINGAGKSSLLKVLAGIRGGSEVDGEVTRFDGVTVGMLEQEPHINTELSVFENVMSGVQEKWNSLLEYQALVDRVGGASAADVAPLSEADQVRLAELEVVVQEGKLLDLERRVRRAMDALGCPNDSFDVRTLSGGERRRIALARLLITEPDLLLLDEPTNHLDTESVAWLEQYLSAYRGTVVAITHDRYFLDNITNWMLEIDRGQVIGYKGNYTGFLEAKQQRLRLEENEESARQRLLARELEWIKKSPKGRRAKNISRVKRYDEMLSESSRRKYSAGTIMIPTGPRLGDIVYNVEDLALRVPRVGTGKDDGSAEMRTLFSNVNFKIEPNSIVGIVGPNGSGKTTLLNALAGTRKADEGIVARGATVRLAYVSQSREELDDTDSVYDSIAEGEHVVEMHSGTRTEENLIQTRAFVASFNFKGKDQQKQVGSLSGGERNRVHLAKLLKRAPNVIFLDEPTNDLDLEVLRNLENALTDYAGVAVIVSHDRYFLDRLCTHIIALDGQGGFKHFDGNYREFAAWRDKQAASSSSEFVVKQAGTFFKKIEAA